MARTSGGRTQHLAPSDSRTLVSQGNPRRGETISQIPMLEPHPAHAEFSAQLCAFVTDWGAGTLASKLDHWLGPNDPPMFTCGAMPETFVPKGTAAYREAGAVAAKALEAVDTNKDNSKMKRESAWLTLDPQTGVLAGTPKGPGVSVFIVAANAGSGGNVLVDAISLIVVSE